MYSRTILSRTEIGHVPQEFQSVGGRWCLRGDRAGDDGTAGPGRETGNAIGSPLPFFFTVPFPEEVELSDFVGEDTKGILFKGLSDTATGTLTFAGDSPDCDNVPVAGTLWTGWAMDVMILNKGGPIGATVYTPVGTTPPEHTHLRAAEITDVRACWIKLNGSSQAYVQQNPDNYTEAAFFIITAEVPVTN